MRRHAGDHFLRSLSKPLRPVLPDQVVIAADAAGGDDHRLRAKLEIAGDHTRAAFASRGAGRFENRTCDAVDGAAVKGQGVDAVAKAEAEQAVHLRSEERRVGKECRSRWSPY